MMSAQLRGSISKNELPVTLGLLLGIVVSWSAAGEWVGHGAREPPFNISPAARQA
jgi:hypothetical protein